MATFAGNFIGTVIYTSEPTNPAIGGTEEEHDYTEGWDTTLPGGGARTNTQPVTEIAAAKQGNRWNGFGFLDWYERIHVYPLFLDLGNVVSVQQQEIVVWNAFFTPHTLNDVVPANNEGLTLTEPAPTPLIFGPLVQHDYILQVSTEGPAIVDATYTFDFDVVDYVVSVTGVRIVAWSWEPNWINPVIERLEWNTDIIPSYDGSEQRRQLRGFPRGQWEFTFDVQEAIRRTFENIIYAWGGRIWALPIWIDVEQMADQLVSGTTFIPLSSTDGRDYREEGIGVIIGPDGTFESFEVVSVEADGVEIQTPLVENWSAGSRVYPARTARLIDPRATSRFHRNYARGLARFQTTEEIERGALDEAIYRELPVMEREPNWREAPDIDYARKLATLDPGYGREEVTDESQLAIPVHSFRWTMLDREEADYFREWLYARRGRCRGIWLPTWSDDLILANSIAPGALNINVQACGLTYFAQADVHRRDIRMQLKDGTIFYRRVSAFVVVDANTERMTMNDVLPAQVDPEDVERISWMHYVRLDTDSIELTWSTPATAEAVIIFRGPRNDF